MRKLLTPVLVVLSLLFSAVYVQAQEGHPFAGTWRGRLLNGEENLPVVLIMSYDGENLQGLINPGRASYPIAQVVHDAPNWQITVSARNRQGEAVSFSGVMHEIGAPDRYIEGSWQQGGKTYNFRITRE